MKIERFQMERSQCLYENEVGFNLSESGVLPLRLGELASSKRQRAELDKMRLQYPTSTGRESLQPLDPLFDELRKKKASRKK